LTILVQLIPSWYRWYRMSLERFNVPTTSCAVFAVRVVFKKIWQDQEKFEDYFTFCVI